MSKLEIQSIHKKYGEVETLKGINIELESGEFLVLLGSSGCGKSTLLNIIAGLVEPTSGDLLLGGQSIVKRHPKDRDIAMVFQSYALYPNMDVARNIGFGLEMRKVPKVERQKQIQEVAKLLQIENLLQRKPSELSGGQRQRVAIGRALVRDPKVFLFDEPLSNLDAKLRMEMRTELKRLHQLLKTTVVYVTHDQIEAMTLATRVAVMRDGRVEQIGTPVEIYNQPATLYVASFVGSPPMNLLDATIRENQIYIDTTQLTLPVPSALKNRCQNGQKIILGIRPEALKLDGTINQGLCQLSAKVEITELTGPEVMITCRIGEQKLTACVPAQSQVSVGEIYPFIVDEVMLHLFDANSGQRISGNLL